MLERFRNFMEENDLCQPTDRILAGVSGGIDSMTMIDLLLKTGFECGLVHCNFKLRGEESDEDERFVMDYAEKKGLPCFTHTFYTSEYAKENRISIQMAARLLRYDWFEEIRQNHGFDYIAIAHNANDVTETFFVNLTRGTGLKGLSGIKPKSGKVIRPLLFATRTDIELYAKESKISFREDSSNNETKYIRNKIRHEIIPLFEKLNPSFITNLNKTIKRLSETEMLLEEFIDSFRNRLINKEGTSFVINIHSFKEICNMNETCLFEMLRPFGFNETVVGEIIQSASGISGRQFLSFSHRLVKDRENWIITPLSISKDIKIYIESECSELHSPIHLKFTILDKPLSFNPDRSKNMAWLDYEKILFPLILRKWQKGDYFQPLGMKQIKKLSDFFVNNKLSLIDKENVWILTSSEKIAWIVGMRIDERFKITEKTSKILKIEWQPSFNSVDFASGQ